jgi:hypothetical protein
MGNLTALSTDNLPPDVHFFAQLTATDHAGVVWVVCIISLTYALLCSSVRFTLRRGMYGFDDAALLVSTLACIVQHAFVYHALENGLGRSSHTINPKHREVLTNVSNANRIGELQLTKVLEQLYEACYILRSPLSGKDLLDTLHSPLVLRTGKTQPSHMRHSACYGFRFRNR